MRHEKIVKIRFLHMEETQSNLLILQMKKVRPREGSQLFEAVVSKCSLQATCLRIPQGCCENRQVRAGSPGNPTAAWAAGLGLPLSMLL